MAIGSDLTRQWTHRQQHRRVADELVADGAACGAGQWLTLARNVNNCAGYCARPTLWSSQRTVAAFANIATTASTLIAELPPMPVRDGYRSLIVWLRAQQRQAVATAPRIIVWSDHRSPTLRDGTTAPSAHAHSLTLTVQSTTWARYTGTVVLVRDRYGQTWLSVWGQAQVAGSALNQAAYSDLSIWCAPPADSGDVQVEIPGLTSSMYY